MNLVELKNITDKYKPFYYKEVLKAAFFNLSESFDEITVLPKDLRAELESNCSLEIKSKLFVSNDKRTQKALITFDDGLSIETVLMSHEDRNTVCVSTQIGCSLGCRFCSTGKMGLKRDLTDFEIVEQIIYWQRLLKDKDKKVDNIVFMGMGEPFLNYENVISAIEIIKNVCKIGARHISVSTVGIVDKIIQFAKDEPQVNLAISLHSPDEKIRDKLIPANKKWSLTKILQAVDSYIQKTNRQVMFEYLMIDNVNDSADHAKQLVKLMKQNKLFVVNLIKYNQTGKYETSSREKMDQFRQILEKNKVKVTQRYSFGQDIKAACGQLAGEMTNSK
ncbi:23S rRNA (adenine(2503)-C(2))-methyltransferase RlmN [Candidatus Falkowbacteria bacterium]|nr:23S rRNA (adenine(2503)-C(2))-methyltransferase RlmN [Candidatus Falkowbacteria bacterium]MBT7006890.1 23S rRNA (adenine(2503)-C(2))-methyltransferase RlmN [Candidatus Falkowbacteria bacterium]